VIAFDHRQGRTWAVAIGADAEHRAQSLARRVLEGFALGRFPNALRTPAAQSLGARLFSDRRNGARFLRGGLPEPVPVAGGEKQFKAAVRRALEYIYAGDIFQVVLSQRFELPDCDGFSLYRTLRAASPAPYHFYLRLGAVDAFAAAFPAGTLSGAPKIRAMEIVDELEGVQRGPYGGAVGWFSAAGDVQLAIAIRTLFRSQGRLFAQAGAGIVADSDPAAEWREVLAKVRASVGAAYGAVAGKAVA